MSHLGLVWVLASASGSPGGTKLAERDSTLKVLLRQRHWQTYATFCAEYDKVASTVDPRLIGTWPSRAQHHRWLSGSLIGLPYPDHCRILEKMFPGWSAAQLFEPYSTGAIAHADHANLESPEPTRTHDRTMLGSYADLEAVFTSRAEFNSLVPVHTLLDNARDIRAVGLSLNMLFQQYPDQKLLDQISRGAHLRCLFLNPTGHAIKAREREEGHAAGDLATLTQLNLKVARKIHESLPVEALGRLEARMYDETIRFNITLIDNTVCVAQPYLPDARGVDSPTFLVRKRTTDMGLYRIFEHVFDSLWDRSTAL
jgi:hypothetical protein